MEYLKKADVWPLNPDGELLLGVKIEDQAATSKLRKQAESTRKEKCPGEETSQCRKGTGGRLRHVVTVGASGRGCYTTF